MIIMWDKESDLAGPIFFNLYWEQSSDLLLILSNEHHILRINPTAEQLLGLEGRDVLNRCIKDVVQDQSLLPLLSESKEPQHKESVLVDKTLKIKIHWTTITSFDPKLKQSLLFAIGKKEIDLSHEQFTIDQLETVIKFAPGLLYWKDKNSVYLGCNDEFARLAELSDRKEVVGKTDFDLIWKNNAQLYVDVDLAVINSGVARLNHIESIAVTDNKTIIAITNKVPMRNDKGEVVGVLGTTTDITHQKETESALSAAKEAAEVANHAKSEFIANMSHDIRTPLTGVIGLSEALEHSLENAEDKEKAHMLHESGEELLSMLNEILDDIKVEREEKIELAHECFDLHQTITNLIRLESPATQQKGLVLDYYIADDVPTYILSDHNKIQRVLLNLLGNAIKFTESGRIILTTECLHKDKHKAHIKFTVTDTGIGIPEEVQSQIFNRFFKVSSSYKGMYTGNGLGLHIVQSYVNLLGGHITLTSTLGQGSTFHFDLECDIGAAPQVSKERVQAPVAENSSAIASNAHYHLLLIEDNVIALKTLEMLLKQKGFMYSSATSGEEAWALLHQNEFDLVVSDIGLPGISGTELAQRIRNEEQQTGKSPLPIIALTGHATGAAAEECFAAGIDKVLAKPVDIHELEALIHDLKTCASTPAHDVKQQKTSPLGIDLPFTEEALFQLDDQPLFDEQDALKQIPDKTLLISLLHTYLSHDIQKDIDQMILEFEQGHWDKVETLAHKMKGGVAYLGTLRLKFACQYLERYYKAGHRSLLERLYQQLIRVNQDTIVEIIQWIESNQ